MWQVVLARTCRKACLCRVAMDRDMSCCRVRKFFHVVSILLLRINSFRCNCCRWRGQEEVLAGEDVLQETLAREILKAEEHALARGNYGATVVAA